MIAGGMAATARGSFTETYDDGTDTGLWTATFNFPRIIEPSGGNPGFYLQQGGFSSHIPTWGSASTRYQPGFHDEFKVDSVFTGDWAGAGVTSFSADLDILQAGGWGPERAVTLELLQMDATGFNVNFEATYTLPDFGDTPPVGWQTYAFPVNADSPTIPAGWVFTHGDGSAGTDAEWPTFLQRIHLTTIGYYKPGVAYVGFGTWTLGIDNVHIETVPEPAPQALLSLGLAGLLLGGVARQRRSAGSASFQLTPNDNRPAAGSTFTVAALCQRRKRNRSEVALDLLQRGPARGYLGSGAGKGRRSRPHLPGGTDR